MSADHLLAGQGARRPGRELDGADDVASLRAQLVSLKVQGAGALRELQTVNDKYGEVLGRSAEGYDILLAKYAALQAENETLREDASAGAGAEPYVMVLIDAHSHKFRADLVKGMGNGGSQAAKLLTEAVKQYLPDESKRCRVIVRVYAHLKNLTQDAVKQGVLSNINNPRALDAFAIGFSRKEPLYDFTDVGHETVVESKIVEMFKLNVKNPQCKHVMLGACCSSGYMRVLEAYSLFYSKVSLIQGNSLDTGIMQLPLKRVAFSQVLCSVNRNGGPVELPADVPSNILKAEICWSFQKEGCYRQNCKFKHIRVTPSLTPPPPPPPIVPATVPPKRTHTPKPLAPTRHKPKPVAAKSVFALHLPTHRIEGLIPVNTRGERLDIYIAPPTPQQWDAYRTRVWKKQLCHAFYLSASCTASPCLDDHAALTPDVFYCLQYALRGAACPKGGACRTLVCYNGHVCINESCVPIKDPECEMPEGMHDMVLVLKDWVQPDAVEE